MREQRRKEFYFCLDLGSAVADGKGMICDNNQDTSEGVAVDSRTLTMKARWSVAPAGAPTAMAMDREHRRLFIAGRDPQFFVVMDADSGKVVQSFPISGGVDADAYDPSTGLLFVSTRDDMIHIFHEESPDKFTVFDPIKTQYGAKTMALDPKTHNLYLITSDFGPPPAPTPEQPHPQQIQWIESRDVPTVGLRAMMVLINSDREKWDRLSKQC